MPVRLILFVAALLVIGTFIGFNIEYKTDVRVWFGEAGVLKDVSVLVTFFVMYLVGVLSSLPFLLGGKRKNSNRGTRESGSSSRKDKEKTKSGVRILGAKKAAPETPPSGESGDGESPAADSDGDAPAE